MHALAAPVVLLSFVLAADPAPPTAREIKGTEALVLAELEALEAPDADVQYQPNETLAKAFPGYLFVLASFPEEDAGDLPEPLKPRNLFAVDPDGAARLLATPEDMLALFAEAFDPVKTAEDAKEAAEAALALEQAKFPEQPFAPPENLEAMPDDGGFTASGSSQPGSQPDGSPSGTGPISVNLSFGSGGAPKKIVTKNTFVPPPRRPRRPVTPADIVAAEPVARRSARGPVTNINSPTINKLLPGNSFFKSPGGGAGGSAGKARRGVVAVDDKGKATHLDENKGLGRFVRRQFGPVTTPQQAREVMEAYLILGSANFPDFTFAPVSEKDITVTKNSDGGLTVKGKIFVKGSDKKNFHAGWTFNAKGKFASGGHGNRGLK